MDNPGDASTLRLRPSEASELPGFTALEQDPETAAFILPTTLQQHQAQFDRDDIVYLTIECDARTAGYFILALEADGESVEFRRIVIARRGSGIGQRAIPVMEAWCRERLGRKRIWLDVFDTNQRGRHVYEKLGYRRFDQKPWDDRVLYFYEKRLV